LRKDDDITTVVAERFALHEDDDIATDDALHSGHPIWHAPAELTRDSGSMSLGASLLWGSHCGSNRNRGKQWWQQKICFVQRQWDHHWWCPLFRISYLACACWTHKRLR
jgi:hypothetical protein